MLTHKHADGGFYQYVGPQSGKMPSGDWLEGVCYADVEGKLHWTDLDRWNERFEELDPTSHQVGGIANVQTEHGVCEFTFELIHAEDVVHMFVAAATHAGQNRDHRIETVLQAQANMIKEALHIRDKEDIPDMFQDVLNFHQKFGQEYLGKPRMLPADLHKFRTQFHKEECDEYADEREKLSTAVEAKDQRGIIDSLDKQLDAGCDGIFVLLGTMEQSGFNKSLFYNHWRKVVGANMAKEKAVVEGDDRATRDAKFDIVKPAGWLPPSSREELADNAHFIYRHEAS